MHSLMLQIGADKFEELNRRATEGGFVSIEAYLLHVAGLAPAAQVPEEPRPRIRNKSVVDSGAQGA